MVARWLLPALRDIASGTSRYRTDMRNWLRTISVVLAAACLCSSGCSAVRDTSMQSRQQQGRVTVLLSGIERPEHDVTFVLSAVSLVSETGEAHEIASSPVTVNSFTLKGRQINLADGSVPEGTYKKLRLVITEPSIRQGGKVVPLGLPEEVAEVPVNVSVRQRANTAMFITWNPDASVTDGNTMKPEITVNVQRPELSTSLVYVTNEGSDSVSVINRHTGEIVAAVATGKRPRGIAVSGEKAKQRIYVANSGSNSISVIDATTNQVELEVPVRLGTEPEGIAVATLSSRRDIIFVTNFSSGSVSVIDTSTYQETEKINTGKGPVSVAVDPPVEELFRSATMNFEDSSTVRNFRQGYYYAYVANYHSHDISVLTMDAQTNRCREVVSVTVGWNPVSLSVDYPRGKVYVANYGSDTISVIDIVQLIRGNQKGAVSSMKISGTATTGIIPEPGFDRLYVLKESSGEIIIIRPLKEKGDTQRTVMPPVMGIIPTESRPRSFLLDPENIKFYVVNRGSDSVSVIDKMSKEQERSVPVGKRPYGITMFR